MLISQGKKETYMLPIGVKTKGYGFKDTVSNDLDSECGYQRSGNW